MARPGVMRGGSNSGRRGRRARPVRVGAGAGVTGGVGWGAGAESGAVMRFLS